MLFFSENSLITLTVFQKEEHICFLFLVWNVNNLIALSRNKTYHMLI